MTALLQVVISEFGGDSPKTLPTNGIIRSERVNARGEASVEIETALLRGYGLLDCEGFELRHDHGDLDTWAGVVQQIRHDLGTGTTEVAAQTNDAILDARRTAKTYTVSDGDAGGIARKVILDAGRSGSLFIEDFEIAPTGLVDIDLRSEQLIDAIDQLAALANAEWDITADRVFRFAPQLGRDLSASVVLAEGRTIVPPAEILRDIRPRINDLAAMSAVSEYTRRTAVVVLDDVSIEEIGQRQGVKVFDYLVKESALRNAARKELQRLQRLGRSATFDVLNVDRIWSLFTVGDTVRLLAPSCDVDTYFRILARSWDSDSDRMTVTGDWSATP